MFPSTMRVRRYAVIVSLVAGSAAVAVASALKVVSSPGARAALGSVAAHPDRAIASDVAQLAAVLLLVPGTVGLLRLFPGRGRGAALTAVTLMGLNLVGNAADLMKSSLMWSLARDGVSPADVVTVRDLTTTPVATVVEMLVAVGLLGFPVLALALWRSRAVARWVPLVLIAGVASFFFPINEGLGAGLMWVGFAGVALTMARTGIADRRTPADGPLGQPLPA